MTASAPNTELVGGDELWRSLGFKSAESFRQSARRGRVGIPLVSIPGRRGKFAFRGDLDQWLSGIRAEASKQASPSIYPNKVA